MRVLVCNLRILNIELVYDLCVALRDTLSQMTVQNIICTYHTCFDACIRTRHTCVRTHLHMRVQVFGRGTRICFGRFGRVPSVGNIICDVYIQFSSCARIPKDLIRMRTQSNIARTVPIFQLYIEQFAVLKYEPPSRTGIKYKLHAVNHYVLEYQENRMDFKNYSRKRNERMASSCLL